MGKRVSPSKIRAVLGDKVADKIGNYDEHPGGGKPLKRGEKAPSKSWVLQHRQMQPRDEEGKFTYNAVNNKPLKYPSRGETIPPFLKDVNLDNLVRKGKVTIIHNGNRYTTILDGDVEEFIRSFQVYDKDKGFGEWSKELTKKRGRVSKEEKAAIASGQDQIIGGDKANGFRLSSDLLKKNFVSTYNQNYGNPYQRNKVGKLKADLIGPKTKDEFEKQNPTPQPTPTPTPQPTPKPETKSETKTFDTELAKNNPMEFAKQNKDAILKLMEENPDLSPTKIISLIADGKI